MKHLFLFILLSFLFIRCHAQTASSATINCPEKLYLESLSVTDSSLQINDMLLLQDGSMITCGMQNTAAGPTATISRYDADGNKIWDKKISGGGFGKVILLKDGNLLAAGNYYNSDYNNLLVKFDLSGNIIWRKAYGYQTGENASLYAVREDPADQSIYVVGKFDQGNLSFGDKMSFQKYTSAGNLVYSKKFDFGGSMSVLEAEDLAISNGHCFIAGTVHNYYYFSGLLVNVENSTGNITWTKLYDFNGGEASFKRIFIQNNSILLCGRNKYDATDTTIIITARMNGAVASSSYFTYPELRDFERFSVESDGTIYYGAGYAKGYVTPTVGIAKFHPQLGMMWMKEFTGFTGYPRLVSIQSGTGGVFFAGNAFPGTYTSYGYLGRASDDGETICNVTDATSAFGPAAATSRDTAYYANNKAMYAAPISMGTNNNDPVAIDVLCERESTCDTVGLPDSINTCLESGPFLIAPYKSPQCLRAIQYSVDTAFLQLTSSSSSGRSYTPSRTGYTKIFVSISTECGELMDSCVVGIFSSRAADLGADTVICEGNTLLLGLKDTYETYQWSDNSTGNQLLVTAPGKYFVTVTTACGTTSSDTILVSYADKTAFTLGADTSVCDNGSMILQAPAGYSEYSWSPAYQLQQIDSRTVKVNPQKDTAYICQAIVSGCTIKDTVAITVKHARPLFIGNDTTVCNGQSASFAATGFSSYRWNTGGTGPSITVSSQSAYLLSATSADGCISRDTASLFVLPLPHDFIIQYVEFCKSSPLLLSPTKNFNEYLWSTGDTVSTITVTTPGSYSLTVTDGHGCVATEQTAAVEKPCYTGIAYPNAFTPNKDGKNDKYRPVIGMPVTNYRFEIFSRWGSKVFSTTNPDDAWDGTVNGTDQDNGAYMWTCTYKDSTGKQKTDKGFVVLIR